jgi:hypothetical protein
MLVVGGLPVLFTVDLDPELFWGEGVPDLWSFAIFIDDLFPHDGPSVPAS